MESPINVQVVIIDSDAFSTFTQTSLLPKSGAFIFGASMSFGSRVDLEKFLVCKLAELEWYAAAISHGHRKCREASIVSVNLIKNGQLSVLQHRLEPSAFIASPWQLDVVSIEGMPSSANVALRARWMESPMTTLMVVVRWS